MIGSVNDKDNGDDCFARQWMSVAVIMMVMVE